MLQWLAHPVVVFLALAMCAEIAERVRPSRVVDRLRHIGMDLGSFGLAVVLNRGLDTLVGDFAFRHAPHFLVELSESARGLPSVVKIVLALLLVDGILYWLHRAQHTYEWLWRTHAWHHSAEELYWFSGFRTSFLHSFFYNLAQAGIPVLVFGMGTGELAVCFVIGMVVQFWEHVNWRVGIGPFARVFITPDYHRVHHSVTPQPKKNLGTTFSFWDRWFGTYVDPRTVPLGTPLGLGEPVQTRSIPRMIVGV